MIDRETPVLESDRLLLRPLLPEDAVALHPTFADEAVMTFWSEPAHASVDETRGRLVRSGPGWRNWAITLKGDDSAIGMLAAGEKRQGRVVEIGYLLGCAHWGTGIAREAVTRLIDHLFRTEGHRRVFADTDPDNAPSRALLERLGFRFEGTLRGEWETHLGVRDTALYGLLAEEWQ